MRFSTVVLVLSLAGLCSAHICTISPKQRGAFSISTPGNPSCYRRTPYCGGTPIASPPFANTYIAGQKAQFTFQQNLNHWYSPRPGFLDVAISYSLNPSEVDFHTLATIPDYPADNMVTQTTFQVDVQLPSRTCEHCIIRYRYHSNNKFEVDPANNTDAIFYNCADIKIIAAPSQPISHESEDSTLKVNGEKSVEGPPEAITSCSTPDQFELWGVESDATLGTITHHVWSDKKALMQRWDRFGTLEPGVSQPYGLSLLSNFTLAGGPFPEFLIFSGTAQDKCLVYGADQWYDWSYGAVRQQKELARWTGHDGRVYESWLSGNQQVNRQAGVNFVSVRTGSGNECMPVSRKTPYSAIDWQGYKVGAVDPSVFKKPANCHMPFADVVGGCGGQHKIDALKKALGM